MATPRRTRQEAPGSLEALRERNRNRVVATLRSAGAISRADLARRTGLSRSTVSTVVADLVREGLVREAEEPRTPGSAGGRPATPLFLSPSGGAVLAVDLAPTRLAMGLFDLGHQELAGLDLPFDADAAGLDGTVDALADGLEQLLAETGVPRERVIGAAMAIPAPIAEETRCVGQESVIRTIVGASLEERASAALGVAMRLENDANLSALAEMTWGAAEGHRDAVFVELSRGIGAGLIIDGHLHRGASGTAGEIGHVPVDLDGAMCRCGNRGCLELVAGADAIAGLVADRFDSQPDISQVISRAESGDPMCRRALRDAGSRIGAVIGKICNLLNPTVIVIGGDLAAAWPVMEPAVHEALDRSAIHPAIDDLTIVTSRLGARGRLLGGLALVLEDPVRFPLAGDVEVQPHQRRPLTQAGS